MLRVRPRASREEVLIRTQRAPAARAAALVACPACTGPAGAGP